MYKLSDVGASGQEHTLTILYNIEPCEMLEADHAIPHTCSYRKKCTLSRNLLDYRGMAEPSKHDQSDYLSSSCYLFSSDDSFDNQRAERESE